VITVHVHTDVTDNASLIICLQEMYGLTIGGADDMTSEQQVAGQVSLELTSLEHELVLRICQVSRCFGVGLQSAI
jgi:hypothetical protein